MRRSLLVLVAATLVASPALARGGSGGSGGSGSGSGGDPAGVFAVNARVDQGRRLAAERRYAPVYYISCDGGLGFPARHTMGGCIYAR